VALRATARMRAIVVAAKRVTRRHKAERNPQQIRNAVVVRRR